ncbi:MAG: hypothetical protein QNK90_02430 [Opitutaceae bacterium]
MLFLFLSPVPPRGTGLFRVCISWEPRALHVARLAERQRRAAELASQRQTARTD